MWSLKKKEKRAKKAEKKQQKGEKNQMFGKLTLEKFKSLLLMYYKQECALDDGSTYFEPQDSLFGEMFDNGMRIKILKAENKELEGQYDDDEIMAQAKAEYEEDKLKLQTSSE